jgi:8-oxo-dGTP pyrophosphatase MutT (NUDIX family)
MLCFCTLYPVLCHLIACRLLPATKASMPTVGVFAAIFDAQVRILCVKLNYRPLNWTTPGGRVEAGESPVAALFGKSTRRAATIRWSKA